MEKPKTNGLKVGRKNLWSGARKLLMEKLKYILEFTLQFSKSLTNYLNQYIQNRIKYNNSI